MLNLALVAQRFGDTPEYTERPLFKNRRLNRALILKHTIRDAEREFISKRGTTVTKVILPYSTEDLSLGGTSFFVAQRDFQKQMRASVGGYVDQLEFEADVEVLQIIDELPSFDPFLLRERLRRYGRDPARCYFDLSEADGARMRKFVEGEIGRLVELAFANGNGAPGRNLSARMAEKLMTDETAQSLEPLRQTLQLQSEEYREGVFAWKGFLYYNWLVKELAPRLSDLARQILSAKTPLATPEERMYLQATRQRIVDALTSATNRVRTGLRSYNEAFEELAAGKPTAFRDFLMRAPALFLSVGEALSMIMHIESFWRFRFGETGQLVMEPAEAMEIFGEFEATLGADHAA